VQRGSGRDSVSRLRDLPGAERFSIISDPVTVASFVDGNKVEMMQRRTDGEFWEIMEFDFVEGGPFTQADDDGGNFVAVINERTRDRLFRGEAALGRSLLAGGQSFSVVGVVRDVPITRFLAFGEIWVPIGTFPSTAHRDRLFDGFSGILLAEDRSRFAGIKNEFRRRLAEAELSDFPRFETLDGSANTLLEELAQMQFGGYEPGNTPTAMLFLSAAILGLLFMTLPALNLINLNLSRILERASEIGVRKSFGASSLTLIGQFLVENVLLTLIGGLIGLAAAAATMEVINGSGLLPYASIHVNFRVFGYGLILSLVFGVLAGVYPAWRMSRMHPVQALHGRV
jgi:putative ABC transport system permease protein